MTYSVAVAGASGYVGGELIRLIENHSELNLTTVTAHSNAGKTLSSVHPQFSHLNLQLKETNAKVLNGHDVVFLALPHTESASIANDLDAVGLVIDCGADFRIESPERWEKFYSTPHAGAWMYGLPELTLADGGKQRGRLAGAERIAVPGCNVTAVTLALAPLVTADLIEVDDIVANLTVGTSGAGKSSKIELSNSEMTENLRAYAVGGTHRHIPEILQNLEKAGAEKPVITFTPVLAPVSRGIMAVVSVKAKASFDQISEAFGSAYGDENFIDLVESLPETVSVRGSNRAQISYHLDPSGRLTVLCAIDNLVKGTAGAAIQSMNLSLGLFENTGLAQTGLRP
jgi:N-acetyl-gamma-glutamyl-phosphate reductase